MFVLNIVLVVFSVNIVYCILERIESNKFWGVISGVYKCFMIGLFENMRLFLVVWVFFLVNKIVFFFVKIVFLIVFNCCFFVVDFKLG